MLKRNILLISCEQFCCILASLFPKVFFSGIITWSLFVMLLIVPKYTECHTTFYIQSSIIILLYILSMVAYFRTINTGPGSPLDYPQLKIANYSENPFNDPSGTGPQPDQEPPKFMTVHTLKLGGNQGFRYCSNATAGNLTGLIIVLNRGNVF